MAVYRSDTKRQKALRVTAMLCAVVTGITMVSAAEPPVRWPAAKVEAVQPKAAAARPVKPAVPQSALGAPLTDREQAEAARRLDRPEAVLHFIHGYRSTRLIRLVPAVFQAMVRQGVFRDGDTSGVYAGFMAGVIAGAGKDADQLIERLFPVPPEDQVGLIKAIAYSGHPDWQGLLTRSAERMPARAQLIDRFLSGKLPALATLPLEHGSAPIDILWGHYYASGSYEPVLRIISVLPWSVDGNTVEKLTIGSMAKFTLAQNGARDIDLLRLLRTSIAHEPPKTSKILKEVVDAAEMAEIGKIRADALASIEQLKARGPADQRNKQWWGQAGQAALAVGCVVASALGQAQVGIPCVIGGAVSSAALKLGEQR